MAQSVALTGIRNANNVEAKSDHGRSWYPKINAPFCQNKTIADSRREHGISHPGTKTILKI